MARELGALKIGLVSVDGTKIDANANRHRSVRYDRSQALGEQLRKDIGELLARAEEADASEADDPEALEWRLIALAYNCKRLNNIKLAAVA